MKGLTQSRSELTGWNGTMHPIDTNTPDADIDEDDKIYLVMAILSFLGRRQREAIMWQFGILDGLPRTYAQIGAEMRISAGRARELCGRGMWYLQWYTRCQEKPQDHIIRELREYL